MNPIRRLAPLLAASLATALLLQPAAAHADSNRLKADARAVVEHWTPARLAAAIPRDLVIDARGLGYLRRPDGSLRPYGHDTEALPGDVADLRKGKPGGGGDGGSDTTPPSVTGMIPADGATIGNAATFSAIVTDASGIKSVSFVLSYPDGRTQSFTPNASGDVWTLQLQGFTAGDWGWQVVAKDNGPKGGNTATTPVAAFTATGGATGGGGGGGSDGVVVNDPWTAGGAVQTAAGRIYFQMPSTERVRGSWGIKWYGYVCSGTVVRDDTTGRSVILTAAHCVYEDVEKAFAANVMFIPNQDQTSGGRTDTDCGNDPLGCWTPAFGVVDTDWTARSFPDNIPWDYAYYVVPDSGAHLGTDAGSEALDQAAGALEVSFTTPQIGSVSHALGYSYADDPYFMYCAEAMTTEGADNWWLPSCGLSGGASGGPWVQPMDTTTGSGPVISVNSWGYTTSPGMAGPILSGTTAGCLFDKATSTPFASVSVSPGEAGVVGCY